MKISRIVFPGYVKNNEKAVEMLGGSKEIYEQCSAESPHLKISFRPNDPLAHTIESTSKIDPCVIIRIKVVRQFKIEDGKKKIISQQLVPEYLGSTSQSILFGKPSDFQFLPSLSTTLNEPTVQNPPPQNFLYLPPPVFIHNYNYDAYYIQRRIFSSKQHESVKLWKKDECSWIINQNDLYSLENGPKPPPIASDVVKELVEIFEELFKERPIWTTLAIFDYLNENYKDKISILEMNQQNPQIFHCLAVVAYHIRNGPFQMCWIRYGINPILTPNFALYQSVLLALREWPYADDIIQSTRKATRLISQKISSLPIGISKINAVPERLLYAFQLFDVNGDRYVKQLLDEVQDEFSSTTGWYSSDVIDKIRKFELLKLQRMILDKKNTPPSIIMADVNSDEQVQKELDVNKTKGSESFDKELYLQTQSILDISESADKESLSDLKEYYLSKSCSKSFDRILNGY